MAVGIKFSRRLGELSPGYYRITTQGRGQVMQPSKMTKLGGFFKAV